MAAVVSSVMEFRDYVSNYWLIKTASAQWIYLFVCLLPAE